MVCSVRGKEEETIISNFKSKYWQRTHKCVIRIPNSVKEAYVFDKENGNKLRMEGINK